MLRRSPQEGDGSPRVDLVAYLDDRDIEAFLVSQEADLSQLTSNLLPQIAIVDMTSMSYGDFRACIQACSRLKLPVIGLVPPERVRELNTNLEINDFVVCPPDLDELETRAKYVIYRTSSTDDEDVIRVGELAINPTNYEVSLSGRRINLRFKEYELLRLLATNPGRVYSREALLSQIWGYDYFGGTRTVDVHIRRLRSKIEDAENSFIETIWNVGYRFKSPDA